MKKRGKQRFWTDW